ncbi:MAG: SEC-C metal-binding domain-containing protein [Planctomycetota bacterium]
MANAPNLDPYAPCHCGSGKKYKFCCMKSDRKDTKPEAPPPVDPAAPRGDVKGPGSLDSRGGPQRPASNWRPPPGRTPGRNG